MSEHARTRGNEKESVPVETEVFLRCASFRRGTYRRGLQCSLCGELAESIGLYLDHILKILHCGIDSVPLESDRRCQLISQHFLRGCGK